MSDTHTLKYYFSENYFRILVVFHANPSSELRVSVTVDLHANILSPRDNLKSLDHSHTLTLTTHTNLQLNLNVSESEADTIQGNLFYVLLSKFSCIPTFPV